MPAIASLNKPVFADSTPAVLAESKAESGRCLKAFSYSGPTTAVCVREDAKDGAKIYIDRNLTFRGLPDALKGCDWVQTANADKLYSAVDLMELAAGADSTIYIAHDDRVPRPDWLQRQFKATQISLAFQGKPMRLFERQVRSGESLTLGANAEDRRYSSCNMYVVFVKASSAEAVRRAGS